MNEMAFGAAAVVVEVLEIFAQNELVLSVFSGRACVNVLVVWDKVCALGVFFVSFYLEWK